MIYQKEEEKITKERKIAIVERLRKLDKEMTKILNEREALREECRDEECYIEIWNLYFSDGKSHIHF